MKRRTLLRATGALAATAVSWTTACDDDVRPDRSSGGAPPGSTPPGSTATATDATASQGDKPPADRASWEALRGSLDGRVVTERDPGYDTARLLYNTRFDLLAPAAVAYVKHPADVAECLAFARRYATPVAIRNGGHSYGGWSSGDGRLVIDVSALSKVSAPSGGIARVGAGAKLIDIYTTLAPHGVTVPGGSCPTVGISGLTLGGGHGVVSRAYGLTCDSLTGATVVTADGRTVECDNSQHSDLFWAVRGAGNGNFGVVTDLRFRTHRAPDAVMAYMTWPWSKAAGVVRSWQEWGPAQPDEIWSTCHLDARPGLAPVASVTAFSLGTYGDLQNAVDRLADRAGGPGPASAVSLRPTGFLDAMEEYAGCTTRSTAQCHLPGAVPGRAGAGRLGRETYAARSDFYDRSMSASGVRTLMDQVETAGRAGFEGTVSLTALGGAINRVSPTKTAFVHRRSRFLAQYVVSWAAGTSGTAQTAWLRSVHTAMRRHASGAAYQNYADPSLADWKRAYYGSAVDRLTRVKRRYDPRRLFSTFPQAL